MSSKSKYLAAIIICLLTLAAVVGGCAKKQAQSPSTGAQPGRGPAERTQVQAKPGTTTTTTTLTFTKDIKPLADKRCKGCHQDKMSDYTNVQKYVTPGKPDKSLYYTKAIGQNNHPGGNAWKEDAGKVKSWIESGAGK